MGGTIGLDGKWRFRRVRVGVTVLLVLLAGAATLTMLGRIVFAADPPVLTHQTTDRYFSPNGDGQGDAIGAGYHLSKEADVTVTVADAAGVVLRTIDAGITRPATSHGFSWDGRNDAGTVVADGVYTWRVRAVDASNLSAEITGRFGVDTRVPGRLIQPAPGDVLSGTATIVVAPNAGFLFDGVSFYHSGRQFGSAAAGPDGTFRFSFDTKTLPQGAGSIFAYLGYYDPFGQSQGYYTPEVAVTLDNPPVLTHQTTDRYFSPNGDGQGDAIGAGYHLSKEADVTVTVADAAGVVLRTIDAGITRPATSHGFSWDGRNDAGTVVADGVYTWRVRAVDASNLSAEITGRFGVDTRVPGRLIQPAPGDVLSGTTTIVVAPNAGFLFDGVSFYHSGRQFGSAAAGPDGTFRFSFDTKTLPQGAGSIFAYLGYYDPFGQSQGYYTPEVAVTLDNPPVLTHQTTDRYFSPNGDGQGDAIGAGYHLSKEADVTVTVADAAGVVLRTIDAGITRPATSHGFSWDGRNDAGTVVADGVYTWRVRAVDASNLSAEITGRFGVDTRVPGRLIQPAPGDVLSGTATIVVAPNAGFLFDGVSFYHSGRQFGSAAAGPDGTFRFSFDTKTLPQGAGSIFAYLGYYDPFGQSQGYYTPEVAVTLDNPPVLTHQTTDRYFSPNGDGQGDAIGAGYHLSKEADVTVTVADAAGVVLRTIDAGITRPATSHGFSWDGRNDAGTVVADGVYTWRVRAVDASNLSAEITGRFGVDTRVPGRLIQPAPGDVLSGTATIVVAPNAGFLFDGVSFYHSGRQFGSAAAGPDGTFRFSFDTKTLPQGAGSIFAYLGYYDPFGQSQGYYTPEVAVTLDNPPVLTHQTTDRYFSPNGDGQGDAIGAGYHLSKEADVTVTVADAAGVVLRTIDAGITRPATSHGFSWDGRNDAGTVVADGVYTWRVRAVDASNLSAEITGRFGVDTRVPGRLIQPAPGDVLSGTATIVVAPNAGFLFDGVSFYHSGRQFGSAAAGPDGTFRFSFDTKTLPQGAGSIFAYLGYYDPFGQSQGYYTPEVAVTVSNPPRLNGLSGDTYFTPNGDGQEDVVSMSYFLSDAASVTVTISAEGGSITRVVESNFARTAGTHSFSWDGRNDSGLPVADGIYAFEVRAVDSSGLSADAAGRLGVDSRVPGRITQPSRGDVLSGTATLVFTPTVGFGGINQVVFCAPGCNYMVSSPAADGTFRATVDSRSLSQGATAIAASVTFTDPFGVRHGYAPPSINVTVDNVNPLLSVSVNPSSGRAPLATTISLGCGSRGVTSGGW